jgi:hypothetical protein
MVYTHLPVFISQTEKLKVQYYKLSMNKLIKDSTYSDGIGNISNVLNKGIHEALDEDPNDSYNFLL